MELRTTAYYNPFYVEIKGTAHFIREIFVFDDGNIIAHQNKGWFGSNNYLKSLSLDCDCVMKRTVDLKCKTAFMVKSSDACSDAKYILYIPNYAVNLGESVYDKPYEFAVRKTTKSTSINGIEFESYAFFNETASALRKSIDKLSDELSKTAYRDFEGFDDIVAEMVNLKNRWLSEKSWFDNASIEELKSIKEI